MAAQPEVQTLLEVRMNEFGCNEHFRKRTHIRIDDLKMIHRNQYLVKPVAEPNKIPEDWNTVPHYPRPVEFHVSKIARVTTGEGLDGIQHCGGFKGRETTGLLWWSMVIGPEEINHAEQLLPIQSQKPFLHNFTTSPVFLDKSRYGNFRFTFSLANVLQNYGRQFCGGQNPVLRVYETVVYKQEVMYAVLVHSPYVHDYDDYPVLGDNGDGVCAYRGSQIIWRAQAMSETHRFRLDENMDVQEALYPFYVWDNVALAFHMPQNAVLEFPREELKEALTACDIANVRVDRNRLHFTREAAEEIVQKFKAL